MLDVVAAAGSRHGHVSVRAGGSAVNAALAAVASGAQAAVVARIGDDPAGAAIRAELAAAGVEARLAVDPELPTGSFVRIGDTIVADRGASAALAAEDVAAAAGADAVLVSGYTLDTGRFALGLGAAWTAVDLVRPEQADQAAGARVVFSSDTDLELLSGHFEVAVVKLGAQGAVAASRGTIVRAAADPVVTSLPIVGAGDALDAAMLLALARGLGLEQALAAGMSAAAAWIGRASVARMPG
jgi:ribokinase